MLSPRVKEHVNHPTVASLYSDQNIAGKGGRGLVQFDFEQFFGLNRSERFRLGYQPNQIDQEAQTDH